MADNAETPLAPERDVVIVEVRQALLAEADYDLKNFLVRRAHQAKRRLASHLTIGRRVPDNSAA